MGCVGGEAAHTPPAPQVIEMIPDGVQLVCYSSFRKDKSNEYKTLSKKPLFEAHDNLLDFVDGDSSADGSCIHRLI